ncbi:peptidase C14 [Deinococcus radiotolerans]|uniref:Peptidase C14 n=1 Tax=Deinococcus radiotolerans TaxID=1309407 RepID=A0ABQ2FNI6_9DEIO|nr:peptidase C14 [Deinococcus radiotolerans]
MGRRWIGGLTTLGLLTAGSAAQAESRALLIGVAEYQDGSRLDGVSDDVQLMRDVAVKMGFTPAQIVTLRNQEATKQGILDAVARLARDVGPGERALLYFSGHGTQVPDQDGDERDGCDEALLPYDLAHPLTDDELSAATARVQTPHVLMVVDSCFSGTISKAPSRSMNVTVFPKFKSGASGLTCGAAINVMAAKASDAVGRGTAVYGLDQTARPPAPGPAPDRTQVTFSAAAPNEVALAAPGGSFFTRALHERVMGASGAVSFAELREYSAEYARRAVEQLGDVPFTAQHPQLDGPAALLNTSLLSFGRPDPVTRTPPDLAQVPSGAALLDRYLNTSGFLVTVTPSAARFRVGQPISYAVTSSDDGYLNLLELDEQGNIAILFPNQYAQDNRVLASRTYTLPAAADRPYRFVASEPLGITRVVALVSAQPLNLYTTPGNAVGPFRMLLNLEHFQQLAALFKATSVLPLPTSTTHGAGSAVIEVRR